MIYPVPPAASATQPARPSRRGAGIAFAAILVVTAASAGPKPPSPPPHQSAPAPHFGGGGFGGAHPGGGLAAQPHYGGFAAQPHYNSPMQAQRAPGGYGQPTRSRAPQSSEALRHGPQGSMSAGARHVGPTPTSSHIRQTSAGGHLTRDARSNEEHDRAHDHDREKTAGHEGDHLNGHDRLAGHGVGEPHRFAYRRPEIPGLHRAAFAPRSFLHADAHRNIAADRAFVDAHRHDFHAHRFADFNPHERALWRRGLWRSEWHYGRRGWWWEAGGAWYPYPEPIYPFPLVVADLAVYDTPVIDGPDFEPLMLESEDPTTEEEYAALVPAVAANDPLIPPLPAPPQGWFYCANPGGYFPDVPACAVDWTLVQTPPPDPS